MAWLTAMHIAADGHDTELRPVAIVEPVDHVDPLKRYALPVAALTATQNVAVGHEIDEIPAPTYTGVDHEEPLNV